ncbi:MAG: AraC family transcriptional regulator [Dorea sp.]|jgi:AraC-like DNA-binding protein|nr:AraC family transcriptional regulator [Dorea sp.]
MGKKKKAKMEYRYYKMPADSPILALLGQKWIQEYGVGTDFLHFHNYMEIGYCYEGQGYLTLGDQDYRFFGNQFSIIPKNYPHTTMSDPGTLSRWEYLFVDVDGFLRKSYREGDNVKKLERVIDRINSQATLKSIDESPKTAGIIREILSIMRKTEYLYMKEIDGFLLALLINIFREYETENIEPDEQRIRETMENQITIPISRALDYISFHYNEPLKIGQLADWCHISETHFRRVFSSYMQMSPLEYINLVRIQNACDYLKKTDESISDISYKCGFSIVSTFYRNFKQIMGVTPYEWRKRPENYEQQILNSDVRPKEES